MESLELLKRGTALQRSGDLAGAARIYEQVLAIEPANIKVLQLAGVVYTRLKDYASAIERLSRAAQMAPQSAEILNSLGLALFPAGRAEEAIAHFERAQALDPGKANFANNLGNAHFHTKDMTRARSAFERALRLRPDYIEARSNLGHCLVIAGEAEAAIREFEAVLGKEPGYRHAIEGLVLAYSTLERHEEVVAQRRRRSALDPQNPSLLVELGISLQTVDRHAEAIDCFRKALVIDPGFAAAHARIGWARMEQGRLDEAQQAFEKACSLQPRSCLFANLLLRVKKASRNDGTVERLEQLARVETELPESERAYLHYALGKALADLGEHARSFEHYLKANAVERAQRRYDERAVLARMDRTAEVFSPEIVRSRSGSGEPSRLPIFIVGMPRSGSTLVEQILAGHPDVIAAGELAALRDTVQATDAAKGKPFPEWIASIDGADARAVGEAYIQRLMRVVAARRPGIDLQKVGRITDKMLGNFLFLGLIHLALPNARIVHTLRDPVETCLSCFKMDFQALNFTNDLGELGRYYRHYRKLMEHWRSVLPPGLILDVRYEELVRDPEAGARRIITHCGLDWDERCLAFDTVQGPVRTASFAQVRRPIYATSVTTVRPSDAVLRPLLDGLNGP